MHMVDLMSSIICEGDTVSQELLDTVLVNLVPAHKVHARTHAHTHLQAVHTHTHTSAGLTHTSAGRTRTLLSDTHTSAGLSQHTRIFRPDTQT